MNEFAFDILLSCNCDSNRPFIDSVLEFRFIFYFGKKISKIKSNIEPIGSANSF